MNLKKKFYPPLWKILLERKIAKLKGLMASSAHTVTEFEPSYIAITSLPVGWYETQDPVSKKPYFYSDSGAMSWKRPRRIAQKLPLFPFWERGPSTGDIYVNEEEYYDLLQKHKPNALSTHDLTLSMDGTWEGRGQGYTTDFDGEDALCTRCVRLWRGGQICYNGRPCVSEWHGRPVIGDLTSEGGQTAYCDTGLCSGVDAECAFGYWCQAACQGPITVSCPANTHRLTVELNKQLQVESVQ